MPHSLFYMLTATLALEPEIFFLQLFRVLRFLLLVLLLHSFFKLEISVSELFLLLFLFLFYF